MIWNFSFEIICEMKIFSDLFLRNYDLNKKIHFNQLHHLFRNFSQKQKLLLAVVKNTFSKIIFATTKIFIWSQETILYVCKDFLRQRNIIFCYVENFFLAVKKNNFLRSRKFFSWPRNFLGTTKTYFSQ